MKPSTPNCVIILGLAFAITASFSITSLAQGLDWVPDSLSSSDWTSICAAYEANTGTPKTAVRLAQ